MKKTTDVWQKYLNGQAFKNQINLYNTVDENWRFYEGDQWRGCKAPNLPMPVFNIIKPACRFMTVQIKDRKLALKYKVEGEREDVAALLSQMDEYARRTWDRLNMEFKNLEGLTDAFNTGDYILYHWWNDEIDTGQPFMGDVDNEIIDNVNYYPGNPNSADVQSQPYIIIRMRRMVEEVREMAKQNGLSKREIEMIVPDEDTTYLSGDAAKIELVGGKKCNLLIYMYKKGEGPDRQVYFSKHTQFVTVQPEKPAKLKLYPICMMNWLPRKNCCHGVAETTYLKPNQVYLNKQMAYTQLWLMQAAYPKVIYDRAALPDGWSNKVASAIGVNRSGGAVTDVAHYMQVPPLPSDVWVSFDRTLSKTMELMGVNDVAMGNIPNPVNKSAFIAVRDAAIVPLEAQQQRFFKMMRDMGLIWLDFWINHYPAERGIPIATAEGEKIVPFNLSDYADLPFDTQVQVGQSQMWNEFSTIQTLDNLLMQGKITMSQYLERMPEGYIPDKEKLLEEIKQAELQQQQLQDAMAEAQALQAEATPVLPEGA